MSALRSALETESSDCKSRALTREYDCDREWYEDRAAACDAAADNLPMGWCARLLVIAAEQSWSLVDMSLSQNGRCDWWEVNGDERYEDRGDDYYRGERAISACIENVL
jgi:hypothetical protein